MKEEGGSLEGGNSTGEYFIDAGCSGSESEMDTEGRGEASGTSTEC